MCAINRNTHYAINKLKEKVKLEKRERGIFISRDCVVTETYTGKTYKYRVYNYITGNTKYLGYKKRAIETDGYEALLSKVADLSFYNISYPTDGEELIDYIFTTVLTSFGFKIRMEQIDLSKHMYRTMKKQAISLSDIAVGLGKTHAYLVASIVYHINNKSGMNKIINQPIVISTSSKRLQKAIVREYVPEISKMLLSHGIIDEAITAVIRKGRENYICDLRLKNYVDNLSPFKKNPKEYGILKNLIEGNHVDLDSVNRLRNYDRQRIKVISKHCRSCPENKYCRYRKLLEQMNQPKHFFQVTNHHYMIADLLKREKEGTPLLPDYKIVIYDEAHKLPDVYIDMQTLELEKSEILNLIKKIKPKNKKDKHLKSLVKHCNEVIKIVNNIFGNIKLDTLKNDEESNKYPVKDRTKLHQELRRLKNQVFNIILFIPDRKRGEQIAFEKLGDCIDMIMSNQSIIWIESPIQSKEVVIRGVPKEVNEMLGQDIFKGNKPILLTSGTLSVNGDFSYIKNILGISETTEVQEIHKLSPFNYYDNTLLYQANDIPSPKQDNDEYIMKVGNRIIQLINASYGHALVLFTSYEMMSKIYRILKDKSIHYPLFILSRGNSSAISDYRKSKNGVLLACGSIWEGINFTGDILSHLIIVKLPFLIPDPITEYKKSQINDYQKFKEDILIPQMLTKLKQGYGRAIRTETDTAVISILDIRANMQYKEAVRQALPKCKITYNIEDIKTFIQEKKDPEYFL
ncbi:ATP-dependent DNA helicase [Maledivibacter halophilus]|uniref:ATP-dependent DNA helicase DinG n=1 Tax=Maledivibacter halophilus TaxID=36842 RepID=A0A1T5LPK5_9FIRM|nr:ATP-dependent DNA helicase [Maledivibacter halophilus]SKC77478.1 ATP-dependent DNA helicase DinG [Maledivibacter halophilus]